MNELQQTFFTSLAGIQEQCVQICRLKYGGGDEAAAMLYDATYEMAAGLLELIDGYSPFGGSRYDLVNAATGEHLRGTPPLELHDQLEGILRCGGTPLEGILRCGGTPLEGRQDRPPE